MTAVRTPFSIGAAVWPGVSKLIEEAGEVQQVCGKLLGTGGTRMHWDGSDLRVRLEEELSDLAAAGEFVIETNGLDRTRISKRAKEKLALFRKWHEDQVPLPASATAEEY
jgi:hypothetical protein